MWTTRVGVLLSALVLTSTAGAIEVKSWAYQLQGYDETLLRVSVDLLVVDIDELSQSKIPVQQLKKRNKQVVSYLSIGEAENYRGYWKKSWKKAPPAWLDHENSNWPGNFKVRFWHPAWRAMMKQAVRRIAQSGFDGVYLDVLDAYEYYRDRGVDGTAPAMAAFVQELALAGRELRPGFLVIAQNAAELTRSNGYLELLDGLAKEDTWYDGDRRKHVSDVQYDLVELQRVKAAGKFVLVIDYPEHDAGVLTFCREARSANLIPFVAPRDLNDIPTGPRTSCGIERSRIVSR